MEKEVREKLDEMTRIAEQSAKSGKQDPPSTYRYGAEGLMLAIRNDEEAAAFMAELNRLIKSERPK